MYSAPRRSASAALQSEPPISSPYKIRALVSGNHEAPSLQPAAAIRCRLYKKSSRDKRSPLVDPACLSGNRPTEGRMQKAAGRKMPDDGARLQLRQSLLPFAIGLLPSALYNSTSTTSLASKLCKN